METSTLLLVALALYILTTTLYTRFQPSLSSISGPPLAAWTNLWRLLDTLSGRTHATHVTLHRRYGPVVRLGPNVISISDPVMIPVIYNTGNKAGAEWTKTAFYPVQSIIWHKRRQLNIFSVRDEGVHREMKRKVAGAYTSEALLRMEERIDGCGDLLLGELGRCAREATGVDLGSWLLYYTFDVVGEITFNEKLGFLETGADVDGLIKAGGIMMVYTACAGQIPWLHKLLLGNPLLPYIFPGLERENTGTMFTFRAINRRSTTSSEGRLEMKEGCAGDDMLSRWAAIRARDPDKMSMTDVMVALATNIFAGADTTAISLRSTFYYLLKDPVKMAKAVAEIDSATKAGHLSNPITDRESRTHLPYINACIKEALRMHPAVGMLLERHVPSGGATICGKWVPGGTIVGINPWVICYDREGFEEPEECRPERWLELDGEGEMQGKEKLARMERSASFVFGAGGRVCMGRQLSLIEMRKIVPRILREFELELEDPTEEWKVSTKWFTPQDMPRVNVRRREER